MDGVLAGDVELLPVGVVGVEGFLAWPGGTDGGP